MFCGDMRNFFSLTLRLGSRKREINPAGAKSYRCPFRQEHLSKTRHRPVALDFDPVLDNERFVAPCDDCTTAQRFCE
jgi:hypothetical protein